MSAAHAQQAPQREALINIQYLRAIAAMMVVWVHGREQFEWIKLQFPSAAGSNGVDLFFVISGFIMVYTTYGKTLTPGSFLARRLARIAPLYWLGTLAIVAIAFLAPAVLQRTIISVPHVLASLAFIPMLSPSFPGQMWPLLVPGWTLNYEMAFYGVFALTLLAPQRIRIYLLCASLALLVASSALFNFNGILDFYTNAIVLTFAAGSILGSLYCAGRLRRSKPMGLALMIAGVACWLVALSLDLGPRVIAAGLPACLVVLGACIMPSFGLNWLGWLRRLGDASYSIYLGHLFLLGMLRVVWHRLHLPMHTAIAGWLFMLCGLLVCALGGWLIYRLVEKTLNAGIKRQLNL